MKYFSILLTLGLLTCTGPAHASKFMADTRGNTALLSEKVGDFKEMEKAFTLLLNTANSSINGTYLWKDPKGLSKFGIDLGGKAANGVLSLLETFENKEKATEFTGKFFMTFPIGKVNEVPNQKNNFTSKQRMMIEVGICRGTYNFLEKAMSTDTDENGAAIQETTPAITNKTYEETHILPSIFLYYNRNIRDNLLAGISVGWLKMNNYAALERIQLVTNEPNIRTESIPDTETNVVRSRLTARIGDYEDFDALQVSTDVLFVPNIKQHPFAFNLFFRYTLQDRKRHLFEPGFGIFSVKEGTSVKEDTSGRNEHRANLSLERRNIPWKISYGFVGQWDDDIGEFRFGVVTGYNF